MPNVLMLASGMGLVVATAALWVQGWQRADHRFFAGLLNRRHLELVFGRRLGHHRDRALASYLGSCRHARSSLRATIVSRVIAVIPPAPT